jgi:hypothetical protein
MVAVSRVELDENVVHLHGAAGMEPKASSTDARSSAAARKRRRASGGAGSGKLAWRSGSAARRAARAVELERRMQRGG